MEKENIEIEKKKIEIEIIEDKKKIDWKGIFKTYSWWLVVVLYLEFIFAFVTFDTYLRESVINIFLHSFIVASFYSIITRIFKSKVNKIITSIILGILGLIFSVQLVFYQIFTSFFSFSVMGLGDQLTSFIGQTFKCIFSNIHFIILLFLPLIVFLIHYKKIKLERNRLFNYLTYFLIFILVTITFFININLHKEGDTSSYNLYHKLNEVSLNVEKLGVINAYNLDIYRAIFGFETKMEIVKEEETVLDELLDYGVNTLELNFTKGTSNSDIKKINEYMLTNPGTKKNKYTGLFSGYNLIYITAESFSEIGVSEELTPTLYKLINTGFKFNNFYTPNNLSTIGGEFQSLTGLYPDNSILTKWRSGNNYFPYGLGTVFKNLGYNTFAYHNNWYGFQDRHKYLKSQGFTNYLGCYNGLEKRMNCKAWPQSDDEMIKVTTKDYINSDKPFMAYYMTVSGHFQYNFTDNSMAYKNRKLVKDLDVSENAKAYVATQIELDKALERLISELETSGKLDNTVIVLLADHYPYELSLNDINSLSTFKRDKTIGVNHNALILWNNKLKDIEVDKVCMSVDVLPTVYNLFGVEYDSRLLTGNDIFSSREGLAVFKNRSWVSDSGTYYSNNGKFTATKEVSDDYVSNMNKIINNRLNASRMIVKNDYYKYLFK